MTDHKITGDEVIKALRELQEMSEFTPPICHYEKDITEPPFCKPFEQFQNDVKVALALINRQKAEIEELREIIFTDRSEAIKKLKAEAIKEFAWRLKKKMYPYNGVDKKTYAINAYAVEKAIEDLVKEMMENDK